MSKIPPRLERLGIRSIVDLDPRTLAALTPNEVAYFLEKPGNSIRTAISEGDIPAGKLGSRHLVPSTWVREFVGLPALPDVEPTEDVAQPAAG